ncbi:glutamate synthase-related protein [Actinophytocola oryzae]|uniref:Glutamate synthase-like protein n=1 Tax=Actinophytocola oryzae TaxID=502181 RepID=A0A4R7VKD2_9PSEU|nr:glutamate synthase-related protein [Actinophytocola oryzae]TDV49933.1 glutamate synthase-like protein [Actinophytocola oryzae]
MNPLKAHGFPEADVRRRAREGAAAIFPDLSEYGSAVFGAEGSAPCDGIDALRLVPPVFMPRRLEKLIELGREPLYEDVSLATSVGGFDSPMPLYLSALGSTSVAAAGTALAAQAGRLGLPMVIGENVAPVNGFRAGGEHRALLARITAYADANTTGTGGVVVQQSTEDANAEVWNNVYTDPAVRDLMESGRLAFELKVGQGAKPGLGGLTMVDEHTAARLEEQYALQRMGDGQVLRASSPGTFIGEILRQQVHLMRNNYPRAKCWVKLPPARDVAEAAEIAWEAGADAVTVDGAEGGTGWAPTVFVDQVGLPLSECLRRIGRPEGTLLASGRVHDGARAVKVLALGARAVGIGRAALISVDEDPEQGLVRFAESLACEMRMLVSALGKYAADEPGPEDLWDPAEAVAVHTEGKVLA